MRFKKSKIVIMRGLPGSGKSRYAENIVVRAGERYVVCSADHFFINRIDGSYNFDHSKLSDAHRSCFGNFLNSVRDLHDLVVVDNTNTTNIEMAPYVAVAQLYRGEYDLEIVRCEVRLGDGQDVAEFLASNNRHGVPEETIRRMAARFEKPLPYWPKETIHTWRAK